jgi:rhodanese-related sulfurtransferase
MQPHRSAADQPFGEEDAQREGEVTILDVRPEDEYRAGHIPGAISIPVQELERRMADLPLDREVIAYCRGPYCVYRGGRGVASQGRHPGPTHGRRASGLEDSRPSRRDGGFRVTIQRRSTAILLRQFLHQDPIAASSLFGCVGKSAALLESAERLRTLPDHLEVFPGAYSGSVCGRRLSGHPSSTLGFERRHNRAFRIIDRGEFLRLMLEDIPPRPPRAEETRARNLGREPASV